MQGDLDSLGQHQLPGVDRLLADSIRSSVVLPAPLRPDRVMRSRRCRLNETPRSSGSPAMSLPRSDAITTAMGLMVGPGSMPETTSTPAYPPVPPHAMPPARTINIAGRGEFFLRDSGESHSDQPTVMLLHGWTVSADLNWHGAYNALIDAGYRVLAIDHRGHGRGLRAMVPFRLADCAADAAAVVREIGCGPAIFVGYSMGGTIAQLIARDHRDIVAGIVLSGTAQHFQDPETVKVWRLMGALKMASRSPPGGCGGPAFAGPSPQLCRRPWWLSELTRHSARDIAEAGRELGRFDSRPWLRGVERARRIVITTRDRSVSPANQRELAVASRSEVFEVAIDHLEVTSRAAEYNSALLDAVASVRTASRRGRSGAGPRGPSPGHPACRSDRFRVMRRVRIMLALTVLAATLLEAAPSAFARADGGQGLYGETTDKAITNVMFLAIAFFPVLILTFSLIQWRLDKRKHARMDAARRGRRISTGAAAGDLIATRRRG